MMYHHLFISHSWAYENQYEALIKLLDSVPDFFYKDYSVPKSDPIHNAANSEELKNAIAEQMKHASCVLVLAGVYASYSKWIDIEIKLAKEMGKKIIAIEYWGSERTSLRVRNSANKTVKWNSNSIVAEIRGY